MASCARVLKEESDKPVDFPTSSDSTSCYTLPSPTMESGARKVPVYIRDECRKPSLLANTQLPVVPPKPGTFAEAACSAADKKRSDTLPEVGKAVNPRETANNEASSRHLSLQLLQGKPENLQKVRTTSAPLWLPSNNTRSCERPTTSFPEASLHTTPTSSQRAVKTAATLTSHEKEAASGTTPPRSYLAPTTIPKNAPACDTLGDQTTVESLRRMINQLQFSHSQLELRVNNMEHTLSGLRLFL